MPALPLLKSFLDDLQCRIFTKQARHPDISDSILLLFFYATVYRNLSFLNKNMILLLTLILLKLVEMFILSSVRPHQSFSHTNIHVFSQNKAVFKDAILMFSDAKVKLIKYMAVMLHLMKIWPSVQRDRETQRH